MTTTERQALLLLIRAAIQPPGYPECHQIRTALCAALGALTREGALLTDGLGPMHPEPWEAVRERAEAVLRPEIAVGQVI